MTEEITPGAGVSGSSDPDPHAGVISHAATYLIYTFFAGQPIDIHRVAHRLMKAGVAETAYSAAMPEVRVAPRYGELIAVRQRAAAVREYLSGPLTIRSGMRLMRKYPRSTTAVLSLVRTFAGVRLAIWIHLHSPMQRKPSPGPSDAAGRDESNGDPEDIRSVARQVIEQMEAVEADVMEAVALTQAVGAVQVAVDRRMRKPGYLSTEPYLRLGLRGSRHRFVRESEEPRAEDSNPESNLSPDRESDAAIHKFESQVGGEREATRDSSADPDESKDESWQEVDALALLHRSGVVQVMLRVQLPDDLTGEELVGKVTSKSPIIKASVVPEPLLEPSALAGGGVGLAGRWQVDMAEGVRWREVEFHGPTRLDDLFELYFTAFQASMPELGPNWWCYPVLIADGVGCDCTPEEWMTRHRVDLARAVIQVEDPTHFRPALIDDFLHDVSNVNDSLLFLTEFRGALFRIGRERVQNWPDDMFTLVPIEQALLQRGQLWSLEWQFTQAANKPRNLEGLEQSIISGLDEFRSSQINAGDAQTLVDRMLDKMRVVSLYSRLMDSVDQLHQKVASADARRSSARANVIAFLTLLVALALGLPAIKQSIEIAEAVPDDSPFAPTVVPLVWLGEQGPTGVWAAFLVLVAVALAGSIAGSGMRRRSGLTLRRKHAGRSWDLPLDLRFEGVLEAERDSGPRPE